MQDLDGSLTGKKDDVIVFNNNLTKNNPNCRDDGSYLNGIACSNTDGWIRFAYNNLNPDYVVITNFTNSNHQMASIPKLKKRLTHIQGFMSALETSQEYLFLFDEALYPTNISYTGQFYSIPPGKYVIIKHQMLKKPDIVSFGYNSSETLTPLTSANKLGDWYWENSTRTLSYMVANSANRQPFLDVPVVFQAVKCRYAGCQPPVSPALKLPVSSRPADALYWSNASTWDKIALKLLNARSMVPQELDIVTIPDDLYVVVDTKLPKLKYLIIEGVLEFDNGIDHRLECDILFINGGQLIIGWENKPILTNVEIVINGDKKSIMYALPNKIDSIGHKAIGVYGGLDIHGKPRNITWTTLATTAAVGANKIVLIDSVDWEIGEEIVIGPTSFKPTQAEAFTIAGVSADRKTLTLNSTLAFNHLGYSETFGSASYKVGAPVGLLSRNVKIIGAPYATQEADLFGFRILVSDYSYMNNDGVILYYKGYARLSNVELNHFGQFNRESEDDSTYGILFSNLLEYNYSRPSYVRNCGFNYGYAAAVGIFISASIPIENNVVYHTIDWGLKIQGHSNIIRNNLLVLNYWASTFLTWEAPFDKFYWGALDVSEADSVVMENNFVAGAERIGVFFKGDVCAGGTLGSGKNHSIKNNIVYSSLGGVVILPTQFFPGLTCVRISGFTVFKSSHWGIYYQGFASVIVDSNTLIDNQVNVFTFVFSPSILNHETTNKTARVKDTAIVGRSSQFNCSSDTKPNDLNLNQATTITAYGAGVDNQGFIGIVWANFLSGANGAPGKPW